MTEHPLPFKHRPAAARRYLITLILGYGCFILPNLFFGIFAGGLVGWNLLWCGVIQLVSVILLVRFAVSRHGLRLADIGWQGFAWRSDLLLGATVGLAWLLIQFCWLVPATGGAERADVEQIQRVLSGGVASWLGYLGLGVLGGGLAEELFNRGYVISVLRRFFYKPILGVLIASVFSVALFAVGHLPVSWLDWLDILVPSIAYTLLFVVTGRLTASMAAHGLYNALTVVLIGLLYPA